MSLKDDVAGYLKTNGVAVTDDKVLDGLVDVFNKSLDGNYIPKSKFDEKNEELKGVKGQLDGVTKELSGLKKFEGSNEELKAQIADSEKRFKDLQAKADADFASYKKRSAVKIELLKAGCKNPDLALAGFNLDGVEVDDKDKVGGDFAKQYDAFRKANPYLFDTTGSFKDSFAKGNTPSDTPDTDHVDANTIKDADVKQLLGDILGDAKKSAGGDADNPYFKIGK